MQNLSLLEDTELYHLTLLCKYNGKLYPMQFQIFDDVPNVLGVANNKHRFICVEGINLQHFMIH